MQFIAFGILPIAYFIIFGGILSSFLQEIPALRNNSLNFITTQWFSVIVLAVLIFPLIIKKRIGELSIAGALLFAGVIIFNVLLIVVKVDPNVETDYKPEDQSEFYRFQVDIEFLSSLSTAFVAYGFQSGFFPIYNALEHKTPKNGMKFSTLAMGFSLVIYILIMFTGLYNFGTSIDGDVLVNISRLKHWESYVIRSFFLFIMVTHTPFTFFIGKEAILCLSVLFYNMGSKYEHEGNYQRMAEVDSMDYLSSKSGPEFARVNLTKSGIALRKGSFSEEIAERLNSEAQMSLAIPFSKRSMRLIEVDETTPNLDFENAAAHELLPDFIYYPVTIILFL